MGRGPSDDRLGAKPSLPPPSAESARRAATLFRRLVQAQREETVPLEEARPRRAPAPTVSGGGRRYDYALSVVASLDADDVGGHVPAPEVEQPGAAQASAFGEADGHDDAAVLSEGVGDRDGGEGEIPGPSWDADPGAPSTDYASDDPYGVAAYAVQAAAEAAMGGLGDAPFDGAIEPAPSGTQALVGDGEDADANESPLPRRPPPGVPTIRPSMPRRPDEPVLAEGELARTAREASLVTTPDGATSFHITFRDEVFEDLSCRITMDGDRVVAVFSVQNQNLRRLLEAESGRLRAQLEGRGLRVGEVRVEVG